MQAEVNCVAKKCKRPRLDGYAVCESHFSRPRGLMFGLWAIDGTVKGKGASILVAATHHLHISDVLEGKLDPLAPLVASGHYHEQLVLRRVCEAMSNAEVNGYHGDLSRMSSAAVAQDLIMYAGGMFDDEDPQVIETVVNLWRARAALLLEAENAL